MSVIRSVLLLVGSPRKNGGTSEVLGQFALRQLALYEIEGRSIRILPALARADDTDRMIDATAEADLLLLSFPVYVDTLPAQVQHTLDLIAEHRQRMGDTRPEYLAAITNCGFAEVTHTKVALAVCEQFARETGIAWLGGLGMPMGGAIGDSPLEHRGGMVRHQMQALKMAAEFWARSEMVSEEAVRLMGEPIMPPWLYRFGANIGWGQSAGEEVRQRLRDQPFKKG